VADRCAAVVLSTITTTTIITTITTTSTSTTSTIGQWLEATSHGRRPFRGQDIRRSTVAAAATTTGDDSGGGDRDHRRAGVVVLLLSPSSVVVAVVLVVVRRRDRQPREYDHGRLQTDRLRLLLPTGDLLSGRRDHVAVAHALQGGRVHRRKRDGRPRLAHRCRRRP